MVFYLVLWFEPTTEEPIEEPIDGTTEEPIDEPTESIDIIMLYEMYCLPYNRMPYQIPGLCPGIIKGKRPGPKAPDALFGSRARAREPRNRRFPYYG